jgi:hypothetical protein
VSSREGVGVVLGFYGSCGKVTVKGLKSGSNTCNEVFTCKDMSSQQQMTVVTGWQYSCDSLYKRVCARESAVEMHQKASFSNVDRTLRTYPSS